MGVSCTTLSQAQSVCANLFASPSTVVYLDEFSVSNNGALNLVQSVPLPVTAKGCGLNGLPNRRCTNSGQATAEGQITLSKDNKYIIHTCYDAPLGVLNVPKTVAAQVPRVIARVDMNGIVDTSITLGSFFAPASAVNTSATVARRDGILRGSSDTTCRAAASYDGHSFWAVGTANGIVYAGYYRNATSGNFDLQTVSQAINGQSSTSGANLRAVQIENCNVIAVSAPAPTNQTYPKFLYSMSSGPISGLNVSDLESKTTNMSIQLYPLSPGIGRYFSGTGNNIWNSQTSPYNFEFQSSLIPDAPPLLWLCDDSSNVQYGTVSLPQTYKV
jgi:hypothetical protein